jgi:hypothetical protein
MDTAMHFEPQDGVARRRLPSRARGRVKGPLVVALCAMLTTGVSAVSPDEIEVEPGGAHSSSSTDPVRTTYRTSDEDDWKFYAAIPVWFGFIDGAIQVRDETTPVDINFDNIWSNLKGALFFEAEVQKDDFGVYTDLNWARLQQQEEQVFSFDIDMDFVLFDFGFYWEALALDLASGSLSPRLRLQPYFGGRYMYMGMQIEVQPTPGPRTLTPTLHTAAPVLGMRGFVDFDEHWYLLFTGDGGGFGVDGMKLTWLAELQGGYRFRFKRGDISA